MVKKRNEAGADAAALECRDLTGMDSWRPVSLRPHSFGLLRRQPGTLRRCGGGDEAAWGGRKNSGRASRAAGGRRVATVAKGAPPGSQGPRNPATAAGST